MMSLLSSIADKCPLGTASFIRWITVRNTLHPYTPYLRQPVDKLPAELLYGILILFFHEQGFHVTVRSSLRGKDRVQVFMRRPTGSLTLVYNGKWRDSIMEVMKEACMVGFRKMERRLASAMPEPPGDQSENILVGLDVDSILTEARKKELAWLL